MICKNEVKNCIIAVLAGIMMYLSPISFGEDPIVLVGYYIVYLELAKLLVTTLTGIDAPILIRYMLAAVAVGASVKTYEAMVHYNPEKILVYTLVTGAFVLIRWAAIKSTGKGR